MSFFNNKAINFLNIQIAIERLAESSFALFGPIFLLQQGLSIPTICLFFSISILIRIPTRVLRIPVIKKIGVRWAIILGALGMGGSFLFLPLVQGVDIYLRLYMLIGGTFSALYRQLYHYLFTHYGENDNRGSHVSLRIILTQGLQMVSPLLSALLIYYQNFSTYAIVLSGLFVIVSIILLWIKNMPSIKDIPSLRISWSKDDMYGFWIACWAGSIENSYKFIRVIVVFLTLGEVLSFGAALTLGITIGLVLQLFIGKYIDRGKGILINLIGYATNALILLGRVFFGFGFLPISLLEGAEKLSGNISSSAFNVGYYNGSCIDVGYKYK